MVNQKFLKKAISVIEDLQNSRRLTLDERVALQNAKMSLADILE